MKTTALRLVSFGSAKALTQGGIDGKYVELNFTLSRVPM
jgi:hypothetical protein